MQLKFYEQMKEKKKKPNFLFVYLLYGSLVLNYLAYIYFILFWAPFRDWLFQHFYGFDYTRAVLLPLAFVPMLAFMVGAIMVARRFWQTEFREAIFIVKCLFVCWTIVAMILPIICSPLLTFESPRDPVWLFGSAYIVLGLMVWGINRAYRKEEKEI